MSEKELVKPVKKKQTIAKPTKSDSPPPTGLKTVVEEIKPPIPSTEKPESVAPNQKIKSAEAQTKVQAKLEFSNFPQGGSASIAPTPSADFNNNFIKKNDSVEVSAEPAPQILSNSIPESSTSVKIVDTMAKLDAAKAGPFKAAEDEYEKLAPLEKDVLSIAKEILKKKKYEASIEVDRVENMSDLVEVLYSKCIAKLTHTKGISKEEIFETIQGLERKKWIVTDQRRTKEEIMETPVLRRVLNFIHEHPGTHARDPAIETDLGITRNPFIKHVMVLEAFNLIRTKKIGRTQNYFISNVPEIFDDFVVLFSNPLVPQILHMLLKNDTIGISEIARQLNVYHGAIQYHLKALADMGLILKSEVGIKVNRELLRRYNSLYKTPPFNC